MPRGSLLASRSRFLIFSIFHKPKTLNLVLSGRLTMVSTCWIRPGSFLGGEAIDSGSMDRDHVDGGPIGCCAESIALRLSVTWAVAESCK
eukprot:SAG31_NODE_29537_length_393_cov_1.568027_1_plen_90_part_00